ncbi:MAG: outer membrane beta-barrel protein [Bacteroidota bacterium]
MKRIILLSIALVTFLSVNAQNNTKVGIKGGFNYNMSSTDLSDAPLGAWNAIKDPKANNGWHLGVQYRSYCGEKLYIQPELIYSQTSESYEIDLNNNWIKTDFDDRMVDINLLLGMKFMDMIRVYGGPMGMLNVGTNQEANDIVTAYKSFRMGYQLGIGVDLLSAFTFDVSYKGSFNSDNGVMKVGGVDVPVSQNVSQVLLGVGVLF